MDTPENPIPQQVETKSAPPPPGSLGFKDLNNTPTSPLEERKRPSWWQRLVRIFGVGAIAAAGTVGAVEGANKVGPALGNVAAAAGEIKDELVDPAALTEIRKRLKEHPEELKKGQVVNSDDPQNLNSLVNMRSLPNSVKGKIIGEIQPGTVVEFVDVKGNNPLEGNPDRNNDLWRFVRIKKPNGEKEEGFIYFKYVNELPQPQKIENPLNPNYKP